MLIGIEGCVWDLTFPMSFFVLYLILKSDYVLSRKNFLIPQYFRRNLRISFWLQNFPIAL